MNKIILALDTTDAHQALETTKKIINKIFTVKLGLEFFNANGKSGIQKFNDIGVNNLMLDLKLKDIPQTVYKAIKALDDIKFGFLTIHAQGGKAMIEKAKEAASEIKSQPKILMVTILTSLNDNDLKIMGNDSGVMQQVEHFAKIAKEMGVGVVCSGHEAKTVRKILGSSLQIFTPGVRMSNDNSDDQQRVCTPFGKYKKWI
jgi:orotidine-5'-phosphate decarboxylase